MRLSSIRFVCAALCLLAARTAIAQSNDVSVTVPRLVRLAGTFEPANHRPPAPVEILTLSIYADETGGTPLWQETQNVTIAQDGRYGVLLGASQPEGLPQEIFTGGEARWLGRRFERAGESEQPRVLLASVPYALKAQDAETLGGRPAAAYVLADTATASPGSAPSSATVSDTQSQTYGTANYIGRFSNTTDLVESSLYDTGNGVGLNTLTPRDMFHVVFMNTAGSMTGYAVQNLGSTATSYSGMLFYDQFGALGQFQGFNNVTHEYRINNIASNGSINFMLGSSSKFQVRSDGDIDIPNRIRSGGTLFLHKTGTGNTWFGLTSGESITTGAYNTAVGMNALASQASGNNNTAAGAFALAGNSFAWNNTAFGTEVLRSNSGTGNTGTGAFAFDHNTSGSANTADGAFALEENTTGSNNTAVGTGALYSNLSGNSNVALGYQAGFVATGSNNIYLGNNVQGIAGESNTIYLGSTQTRTFVAGIRNVTTGVANAIPVMVDSSGQLGTVSSSRRFKEDIQDMGDVSRRLFSLRPVTFRYSQAYTDGNKPLQYGLVAEEVAEAFPDLAVRNASGGVDTVHYETLSVLLLNELQKQQQRLEALERKVEALLAK